MLSAEREGFEPPVQLPVHRISSAARSTTPASLRDLGPLNRDFGSANIDIIFVFVHFQTEKIVGTQKILASRASVVGCCRIIFNFVADRYGLPAEGLHRFCLRIFGAEHFSGRSFCRMILKSAWLSFNR